MKDLVASGSGSGSGSDSDASDERLLPESGNVEQSWLLRFDGIERSEHKEKLPRGLHDCLGVLGGQVRFDQGARAMAGWHYAQSDAGELLLAIYCRTFTNEIVKAYAEDHFFDVITNIIGLIAVLLANYIDDWMDPVSQYFYQDSRTEAP